MANTPNLGLHQWAANDPFLRTDFNSDFSKLDTAVGGQLKVTSGTFTGNNVTGRTVVPGFKPKLLLICGATSDRPNMDLLAEQCFLHISNGGVIYGGLSSAAVYTLTDTGFTIKSADNNILNRMGYYIAFG